MPNPASNTCTGTAGGRWFLLLTGLFLCLLGGLFIALMLRSSLRALAMRQWPEVPCVILESQIAERRHDAYSGVEYRHEIRFGYEWQGQRLTGNQLGLRGGKWSSREGEARERAARYPVGQLTVCRVDPARPELAVLELESLATLYSLWFPALFVVGGAGIALRAIRGPARSGNSA